MSAGVRVELDGLAAADRKLAVLPVRVARNVLVRMIRAVGRPIVNDARRRAPVLAKPDPRRTKGLLKRSIRTKVTRIPNQFSIEAVVGVRKLAVRQIMSYKRRTGRSGASNPSDPFYYRFVERGTRYQAARPYLRPAFESRREDAVRAARDVFVRGVDDEVRKL